MRRLLLPALLVAPALATSPLQGADPAQPQVLSAFTAEAGSTDAAVAHPLKLSHGRIDVDGALITARVRLFWDDLEEAIRYMTEDRRFRIGHTAEADSLVGAYLQTVLIVDADGTRPVGRVVQSGEEDDMFWYVIEYRAAAPVRRLTLRNAIMVDLFPEQRNVLQVRNTARNTNRTFYFSSKKEEYSLSF
jgi:hypothetical protein